MAAKLLADRRGRRQERSHRPGSCGNEPAIVVEGLSDDIA
jgi:hypothetical protein